MLGGVRLPQVSGACGTFVVFTRSSVGELIDGGTSTNAGTNSDANAGGGKYTSYHNVHQATQTPLVVAAGQLLEAGVVVSGAGSGGSSVGRTIRAGSAIDLHVSFTSTNPIPPDGQIEIDLVGGFSINTSACMIARSSITGISGELSISHQITDISKLMLTLQRSASSAAPSGSTVSFGISGGCVSVPPVTGGADDGTTRASHFDRTQAPVQ